ncbi:M protein [NL63-related bat coronavirus]|uniref:Membrane protein n=1 Tax=NL63-related bat coronavirus TaxID=1920748 RepID=A0A1L2KGC0_9ALPC|nr:M protein [NL63-related bat coronavirus]APD51478.1 M protein [NL63-related bat coronavirus]
MSTTMSNESIPLTEVYEHLRNWNFSWNLVLTVFLVVLQYGHFQYSKLLYALKMLVLWLLWPMVLALSIFDCWANFGKDWVFFAFSLLMTIITLCLWIMYFVNSFKLYRRVKTFWAFNPETNAIISLQVYGHNYVQPVMTAPTGVTLTLLSGVLLIEGHKVAIRVQVGQLPKYLIVATPRTTIIYDRVGRSVNESSQTGWAFYVRSKHGDFSGIASQENVLSEREKLLHLV